MLLNLKYNPTFKNSNANRQHYEDNNVFKNSLKQVFQDSFSLWKEEVLQVSVVAIGISWGWKIPICTYAGYKIVAPSHN